MSEQTEKNLAAEVIVEGQARLRKVIRRAEEVRTHSGPSERHQNEAAAEIANGDSVKSDPPLVPAATGDDS